MGSGMIIWMLLFWFAVGALLHTYILYPWLLKLWSAGKQLPDLKCPDEDLPMVSVLMAAYNEEKVIRRKLESIFQSDYPAEKLELVVGSDGSTDATNAIMEEFIGRGHRIVFKNFGGRTGKIRHHQSNLSFGQGDYIYPYRRQYHVYTRHGTQVG
jgi:cellulose synthase/poly-beta-1,6-N-acetylglucosamine synthase-like glycosyltransferase